MAQRRIFLSKPRLDGCPVADFEGLPGEEGETEVYHPYGFASGREGEGLLLEIQDDPDNHMALPAAGDRVVEDATVVYWGDNTEIKLTDTQVEIKIGGKFFRMTEQGISTNLDIHTTGDVFAGPISLRKHKHGGIDRGNAISNGART